MWPVLMGASLEQVAAAGPIRRFGEIGAVSLPILCVPVLVTREPTARPLGKPGPLVTLPRTVPMVLLTLVLLGALVAEPAEAGIREPDRFHAGRVYRGSFPDPDV